MTMPAALGPGFAAAFGHAPRGTAFAPGRVNLIGEHVDYNDGLVLPMPVAEGTWVAWSPRTDRTIGAVALDYGGDRVAFEPGDGGRFPPGHWGGYLRGMAESCAARGLPAPGADLAIRGTLPRGAGLSSSASLCVALGRALAAAANRPATDQRELALAAQAAEHRYAGVRCGIMDQMAVALGEPGKALLLDCRDLSMRNVALPPDWDVIVVQSGVERGLVDGHYNARRRDCETAAAALGVASLRDASLAMISAARLEPLVADRAVHVVAEIERTAKAVTAIERRDLAAFGQLLRASHASLRDLFEVSVPEVDALVDALNDAIGPEGGARMTGGGFGGAIVAVTRGEARKRIEAMVG